MEEKIHLVSGRLNLFFVFVFVQTFNNTFTLKCLYNHFEEYKRVIGLWLT